MDKQTIVQIGWIDSPANNLYAEDVIVECLPGFVERNRLNRPAPKNIGWMDWLDKMRKIK